MSQPAYVPGSYEKMCLVFSAWSNDCIAHVRVIFVVIRGVYSIYFKWVQSPKSCLSINI